MKNLSEEFIELDAGVLIKLSQVSSIEDSRIEMRSTPSHYVYVPGLWVGYTCTTTQPVEVCAQVTMVSGKVYNLSKPDFLKLKNINT